MGWTKRQFVQRAFEEIGLAQYVFDLLPEQLQSAIYRLDAMCESWNGLGIRLGYPIPSSPQYSDLDEQTNVPDCANEAIYTNLAIKIAPMFGKQLPPTSMINAKQAYSAMLTKLAPMPQMQLGTIPAGAGQKRIYYPFIVETQQPLLAGLDGAIEYDGNAYSNVEVLP